MPTRPRPSAEVWKESEEECEEVDNAGRKGRETARARWNGEAYEVSADADLQVGGSSKVDTSAIPPIP